MQASEFLTRVQHYGNIRSEEEARRATQATLLTLGERIGREEANDVLAQLPRQIAESFPPIETPRGEDFGLDEFFSRVAARAGADAEAGQRYTRAVFSTLQEAITSGELADVLMRLPGEFTDLFQAQDPSSGR